MTARRTGLEVFNPSPEAVGEMFGRTWLEMSAEEALARARAWRPDVIVADAYNNVGSLLAADLRIPWHQMGLGPAIPESFRREIELAGASIFQANNLVPVQPASYLDPCPPALQNPGWTSVVPREALRPEAHERAAPTQQLPHFENPERRQILVTFGTIFSDPDVLAAVVESLAPIDANVIITLGLSLRQPAVKTRAADFTEEQRLMGTHLASS